MDQEILQQLNKHFSDLPIEAQNNLLSLDLSSSLELIEETRPLDEKQKTVIENEVVLIFLGLRDIQSLTTNIKHGVNIAYERAEKISKKIEQNILLPKQKILEQVFNIHNEEETVTTKNLDGISPINHEKNDEIKNKSMIPQIFKKRLPKMNMSESEKSETTKETSRFKPKINNNDSKSDPYREPIE